MAACDSCGISAPIPIHQVDVELIQGVDLAWSACLTEQESRAAGQVIPAADFVGEIRSGSTLLQDPSTDVLDRLQWMPCVAA